MPNQAYTYTPEYTSDEAGTPQFTGEGTLTPSSSRFAGQAYEGVYEENELTGEREFLVEEADYQQDQDYQPSTDEQYEEAIAELYPELPQALEWMAETLDPEVIAEYNQAVDEMDYSELMPFLEKMMEEYYAEFGEGIPEEEVVEPPNQEEIDTAVEDLINTEAQGDEVAYSYLEAAVEAQDAGDDCLRDVLVATSQYHKGEADATQLITEMMEKYPMDELARVYRLMENA